MNWNEPAPAAGGKADRPSRPVARPVRSAAEADSVRTEIAPREFFCPDWPGCQCPDGTTAADCPGRIVTAPSTVPAESRKTRHVRDADGVVWEVFADADVSDWAVEIDASSGSGGPARASDQASPPRAIDPDEAEAEFRDLMEQAGLGHIVADRVMALPVRSRAMELLGKAALAIVNPPRSIDPDEAVAVFRRQLQSPSWTPVDASSSASLKERAERLLAEMKAVLDRSDDALWMIKRELGHREDLLDAVFGAHVDMGFVSRDLRELIKEL